MKKQNKEACPKDVHSVEYIQNESVELFLTCCGYRKLEKKDRAELDKRNDYMLCILTNGQGNLRINSEVYKVKGNYAILLFPGMKCSFEALMCEECSCAWIGFSGVKAEECVRNSGFSQSRLIHTLEDTELLCGFVKNMLKSQDMTFTHELKRNGLLKLFFAEFIELQEKHITDIELKMPYEAETPAYVRMTISYIAENYASNIKINELADHIGVNRSYLTSSFKKVTGYSPKEYLVSLRMENAKQMLEQTNLPVNSIASSVGYTDQLAFSRMFKRYSGVSPKAYRESRK